MTTIETTAYLRTTAEGSKEMVSEYLHNKLFPFLHIPDAINSEANRLATYRNLGHCEVFASQLAKAGLVYTGIGDEARCYCCSFKYKNWKRGQQPVEIHKFRSPLCPMFTKAFTDAKKPNIPIPKNINKNEDSGASFESSNSYFATVQESGTDRHSDRNVNTVLGVYMRSGRNNVPPEDLFLSMPVDVSQLSSAKDESLVDYHNAKYPLYAGELQRAKTFSCFPSALKRIVPHLHKFGFYYTGHEDIVFCFYCGLGLKDWQDMIDPKIAHARFGPDCHFLCKMVTPAFIQAARAEINIIGNGQ